MRRLPKYIDLGVTRIPIRLVKRSEMRAEAECSEGTEPNGLWDDDTETIFIGRWLSKRDKQEVLLHEVIHAVNDVDYWNRFKR